MHALVQLQGISGEEGSSGLGPYPTTAVPGAGAEADLSNAASSSAPPVVVKAFNILLLGMDGAGGWVGGGRVLGWASRREGVGERVGESGDNGLAHIPLCVRCMAVARCTRQVDAAGIAQGRDQPQPAAHRGLPLCQGG